MMLSLRRFPLVLFFSVWLLFGSAFLLSFLVYLSLSSPSLPLRLLLNHFFFLLLLLLAWPPRMRKEGRAIHKESGDNSMTSEAREREKGRRNWRTPICKQAIYIHKLIKIDVSARPRCTDRARVWSELKRTAIAAATATAATATAATTAQDRPGPAKGWEMHRYYYYLLLFLLI